MKKQCFEEGFKFVATASDYNKDTWDDLMKFVKKRTRGRTEDKIAKVIKSRNKEEAHELESDDDDNNASNEDEIDLSDDEMKHDNIRVKQKKGKGRKSTVEDVKMEFEDEIEANGDVNSFYQMNLSRPLMKAIGVLGYTHPTPIQASTIPIALLGRDICGCAATGIN